MREGRTKDKVNGRSGAQVLGEVDEGAEGFFSLKKRRLREMTLYIFLKRGGSQVGATEFLLPGNK